MLERLWLGPTPHEGPATSTDRDATIDTACRCYLAHEAQMLASARRQLQLAGLGHEDPEDVWRDAQLKILDQLSAGRRLVAEIGDTEQDAYLKYGHAVLRLHVNDLRKKALRRRTDSTDTIEAEASGADVWQQTAHNMALSDWRRALLAKSERTRKVLAMSELGYTREEIAAELGISVKRVGKLQEQGKPLRERVLASRGATRLQEICGGIAARVPLPAGISAVVAKTAIGGGIAAAVTIAAIGGVAGVQAVEHHQKQAVPAAEQARAVPQPSRPARTTVRQQPAPTRPAPRRTSLRIATTARRPVRAPAPARATQQPTTIGTLCASQRICTTGTARPRDPTRTSKTVTPAPVPAPIPQRAHAAAPTNLCIQQGLCR